MTVFFDLGADSIHLFQIRARLRLVGIALAPQQILRLRTVASPTAEFQPRHPEKWRSQAQACKPSSCFRAAIYQLD